MTQINIMALRHSAFYSPLLLAVAGGFLEAEGLQPRYSLPAAGQRIPDLITRGKCHVAQSAVATGFAGLEQGVRDNIVHFAQINARDGFFIAGRQAEEDFRWSNLCGKLVLVDHLFQPLATLKYGLHKQGVDFSQLRVVDAGDVNSMILAFRAGQGDYIHLQGPAPQQLQQDGVGHVLAAVGDLLGDIAFSSLCCHRNWLQTEMARAFMRAYRKAQTYVLAAPAAEIAAREYEAGFFPGIDLAVLTRTIAAYQQLGCWRESPAIPRDAYENLLDVFLFNGLISRRYPYETLVAEPPA